MHDAHSAPPGPPAVGGAGSSIGREEIGWLRAILSGAAIVIVGFVGTVALPNAIVVHLEGLTTFTRSLLATALAVAFVIVMAWGLRRLQARRLI